MCCFQIFLLTALVVRGPSELHLVFTVFLGGVVIGHEKVKGAVACVPGFVRHPLCTQRNFFSETWINMLNTAVIAADAVRNSSKFDPWGAICVEAGCAFADLKLCLEKIVSGRKAGRDTRERWFGAETVASTAVVEAALRTKIRISDVVEVGDVQYVEEHDKICLRCCSQSSPRKSKKRQVPVSPGVAKNSFLLKDHLLAVLRLRLLFRRNLRSRVREKVVVIAVMPQFSMGDINNNLFIYMHRLLAFGI